MTKSHVSFDVEEYIRQLRAAHEEGIAAVRAEIRDPELLASFEAQSAMLPAQECFARVHIGLREAGRDEYFIAAVFGAIAGSFLVDILLNADDPRGARNVFLNNLMSAASGQLSFYSADLEVSGTPMGRA